MPIHVYTEQEQLQATGNKHTTYSYHFNRDRTLTPNHQPMVEAMSCHSLALTGTNWSMSYSSEASG